MRTLPRRPRPSSKCIALSPAEREVLEGWARRPKTAQALALRARIVLACAQSDENDTELATRLKIFRGTIGKWRTRFSAARLDGLLDEPRPGAPRSVSDADVERIIATTLETKPRGATHWSTRSLAAELGVSQSSVSRIWRAFGLKPHRQSTFKLSTDPLLVD